LRYVPTYTETLLYSKEKDKSVKLESLLYKFIVRNGEQQSGKHEDS